MGTTVEIAATRNEIFRHRRPRPGPELELLNGALESGLPTGHRGQAITLREPELPTGSPDLIALYARGDIAARPPLLRSHLQVLHQLWVCRGIRGSELARLLHLQPLRLERILTDLVAAGVIHRRGEFCKPRSLTSIFGVRQIVAIEAKVSDWRTAMRQAQANLWFASESYVLVPERRDVTAMVESAERFGLGLLIYTGQRVRRVAIPKRFPIPSSYGSWLFSEWLNQRKHLG